MQPKPTGLNIKKNAAEEIYLSIHIDDFTKFLQSLPVNSAGYRTLKLVPHKVQHEKGFSHFPILLGDKHQPEL